MKLLTTVLAAAALLFAACGGDDNGNGGDSPPPATGVFIEAGDADRVAREAMPLAEELPGQGWVVTGQDIFGDDDGDDEFWQYIEGDPNCATLQDLAALESVFGSEERASTVGRAQTEYENLNVAGFLPSSVEIEITVEESAADAQGQWAIMRELFQSDDMTQCFVSMLNTLFEETMGEEGLDVEARGGSRAATPPQNGASMAFEIEMAFMGIELDMAMQIYLWAYGNAQVQAMFVGSTEDLTSELIGGVLSLVDEKLQAAAGN